MRLTILEEEGEEDGRRSRDGLGRLDSVCGSRAEPGPSSPWTRQSRAILGPWSAAFSLSGEGGGGSSSRSIIAAYSEKFNFFLNSRVVRMRDSMSCLQRGKTKEKYLSSPTTAGCGGIFVVWVRNACGRGEKRSGHDNSSSPPPPRFRLCCYMAIWR